MVAKVMASGSSMKSAVAYNEDKVKEGLAEVIAEVNVHPGHLSVLESFSVFEARNIRSKDVSFHMSVNPAEGEKLSRGEVKNLVSDLMAGLGYGKQPYVIYEHTDIDRVHYHVVSIRTNSEGRKIPDLKEKKNCLKVLESLSMKYGFKVGNGNARSLQELGMDARRFTQSAGHVVMQMEVLSQECLSYRFTSMDQFRMLMRNHGVDVRERNGFMILQGMDSGGRPCTPQVDERSLCVPVMSEVEQRIRQCLMPDRAPVREAQYIARVASACLPFADTVSSFVAMLDRKGITCSVSTNQLGKITNVTFIDRHSRCVLNASELKGFDTQSLKNLNSKETVQSKTSAGRKI